MKDKIYIRLFVDEFNGVPTDSFPVVDADSQLVTAMLKEHAEYITDWLIRYPKGKVDFVIL